MMARNPRNSTSRGTGEKTSPIHGAKDEVASARKHGLVGGDLTYPWGVGGLYIAIMRVV